MVLDDDLEGVGRVVDVFGPVSRPHLAVTPDDGVHLPSLIDRRCTRDSGVGHRLVFRFGSVFGTLSLCRGTTYHSVEPIGMQWRRAVDCPSENEGSR